MDELILSVCLITYNHQKFIKDAIEGVLNQKVNFAWNLIIADDYSTDGTREILLEYKKKYPDLIHLILQERNVGAAKNWIDLITYPRSKYIAYFEGDDYWTDPLKLEKQISFMEANADFSMCFHSVDVISEKGVSSYLYSKPKRDVLNIMDIIREHYIPTCSLLFRNGYFPQGLPKWFNTSISGDIPFEILLSSKGKTKFMDEKMGCYRRHPGGVTQSAKQNANIRAGYIQMYSNLSRELSMPYYLYLQYVVWRLKLGYIKQYVKNVFKKP